MGLDGSDDQSQIHKLDSAHVTKDIQNMLDQLQRHHTRVEEVESERAVSGSSESPDFDEIHRNLQMMIQQLKLGHEKGKSTQQPSQSTSRHHIIHDELEKELQAEEAGHLCDLCEQDLAIDPERPRATLRKLSETCVLVCGHVYHIKCLRSTTLDLDQSPHPSCIFCSTSSS